MWEYASLHFFHLSSNSKFCRDIESKLKKMFMLQRHNEWRDLQTIGKLRQYGTLQSRLIPEERIHYFWHESKRKVMTIKKEVFTTEAAVTLRLQGGIMIC